MWIFKKRIDPWGTPQARGAGDEEIFMTNKSGTRPGLCS